VGAGDPDGTVVVDNPLDPDRHLGADLRTGARLADVPNPAPSANDGPPARGLEVEEEAGFADGRAVAIGDIPVFAFTPAWILHRGFLHDPDVGWAPLDP